MVSVSAVASLSGSSPSDTATALVAPVNQSFSYDDNGSLINDSVWVYHWDGENRLKEMSNTTSVASAHRKRLQFQYDYLGRRLSKKVSSWNTGLNTWNAPSSHTVFIYDGWNLIAELDGTQPLDPLPLVRSHAWGLDLTGSLDETAGIGGLVLSTDHTAGAHYYPAYDGNGNVTALVKSDGTVAALYEYSPYGELLRATGAGAYASPFLFSTKYYDRETTLSYYGHRYYDASLGRWLNEDPIEEEGGANLYAFVANNPLNAFDLLGATGNLVDTQVSSSESASIGGSTGLNLGGYTSRFGNAIGNFNDIQEFTVNIIEAAEGDPTDLMITFLELSKQVLSSRLRGAKVAVSGPGPMFEMHHIFPQRKDLKRQFESAGINIHDWKVRLERNVHKGVHQGGKRGGDWNEDWSQFLRGKKKSANDMFDFAFQMMQKYGVTASRLK